MRQYLDPTEIAQVVQLLWDSTSSLPESLPFLPAQSQEHRGVSKKQAVTVGELDRAIEAP